MTKAGVEMLKDRLASMNWEEIEDWAVMESIIKDAIVERLAE